MTERYLCIGGKCDGQYWAQPFDMRTTLQIPDPAPMRPIHQWGEPVDPRSEYAKVRIETYVRMHIAVGEDEVKVWVPQGVKLFDAVKMLIAGYTPMPTYDELYGGAKKLGDTE